MASYFQKVINKKKQGPNLSTESLQKFSNEMVIYYPCGIGSVEISTSSIPNSSLL